MVHDVVVHLLTQDPALVQEPLLFHLLDLVAGLEHVVALCDSIQEIKPAADEVIHLLEELRRRRLAEIPLAVVLQGGRRLGLGQVENGEDLHPRRQLLEALVYPIVVAVEDHGHQTSGSPLLGALLQQLDQVLAVVVVPDQVHLVDDHHERPADLGPAPQRHLLQLVEGALDVEERRRVPRAALAEVAADVVLVELVVERLAQADPEDLEVGMGLEHGHAVAVDLTHGLQEHAALARALLADEQVVVARAAPSHDGVNRGLLGPLDPVRGCRRRGEGDVLAYCRQREDGIAGLEGIGHLLQHHVLVRLVVHVRGYAKASTDDEDGGE